MPCLLSAVLNACCHNVFEIVSACKLVHELVCRPCLHDCSWPAIMGMCLKESMTQQPFADFFVQSLTRSVWHCRSDQRFASGQERQKGLAGMTIWDRTPFISQCISISKASRGDHHGGTQVQMDFLGLKSRDPNDVLIISQFISASKAMRGEHADATAVQRIFLDNLVTTTTCSNCCCSCLILLQVCCCVSDTAHVSLWSPHTL